MATPARVRERIQAGLERYRAVLETQRDRDVAEADTVTLVQDLLSDVFGYDKYTDITHEPLAHGTSTDLAIMLDEQVQLVLTVKAIGLDLNDAHVRQALDRGVEEGVEWVALTNAVDWALFRILYRQPIEREEVVRFNLLELDPRREGDLQHLYLLTKEGHGKSAPEAYRGRKGATSRFLLAQIVTRSDPVIAAIRREIHRTCDVLVDKVDIERVLRDQVIKREALEGRPAAAAREMLQRATRPAAHAGSEAESEPERLGGPMERSLTGETPGPAKGSHFP